MKLPRQILVVNNDFKGERYAIPSTSLHTAWVLASLTILETLKERVKDDALATKLTVHYWDGNGWLIDDEEGTVWIRIFIQEEGKEGVYLGFDSGERDNYAATLPLDTDTYGDGIAYLFRTKGKPCNQKIEVSEVK